ncbi:MAG: hypothetical protein JW993_08880 [Sedimentisphaerales bacterium]|nr:hypothetical protein [Sedimentisphaerales bacterium]
MKTPELNEAPTVALRRLHRWRMALSGLAILIAGITIGAAGAVLFIRPEERLPPPDLDAAVAGMVGWFRDELNLSHDQLAKIESVVRLRMGNLDQLRRDARPKIEEELQAMKREIDEVLTEEQRDSWQRIMERLEREFHRGLRRPGGRGGPRDGFRDGRRGPRRGGRPDGEPNAMRRYGDREFDPNASLRRGDPNGPFRRGGPRPDWQNRDGERRSFDRRGEMEGRPPEPNMTDPPSGPNSTPPGPDGF